MQALGTLAVAVGWSIPAWIFTPAVASFGTLVVPNLSEAVFAANENNGRTAGDGPVTLYAHLAWVLILLCATFFVIKLAFGAGTKFLWLLPCAFTGGLVAFFWQVISEGGALWQWNILPCALACSYLLAQILTSMTGRRTI